MHSIDRHKKAVAFANAKTFERFSAHGPYTPDTPEHDFWLRQFDIAMAHGGSK